MNYLWWTLIFADALLIVAVLALLMRLRRLGNLPQISAAADLQVFLQEAARLSQEFDRLLGEKRELVRTTLTTLDDRISKLKKIQAELEKPAAAIPVSSEVPIAPDFPKDDKNAMALFRKQVLKLARQGKNSTQISQATGRPRGEVELLLELNQK